MSTLLGEATVPFSVLLPFSIYVSVEEQIFSFNPIALRKAKIAYNFGRSECIRVKFKTRPHFGRAL